MNCDVIFYEKNTEHELILKEIRKKFSNFKVITNDTVLNQFLNSHKIDCDRLDQIYPDIKSDTNQIYQSAVDESLRYQNAFAELKFFNFDTYSLIEPLLLGDFIIIEKIRHILNSKQNYVFVFLNYSFMLYLIKPLAKELGYDINNSSSINQITNKGIELILPKPEKISWKKKLLILKNKIFQKNKKNISDSIINKLKKIKGKNKLSLFVVTPSSKYVLKSIYSVLKIFSKESQPHLIITFDYTTAKALEKEGFDLLNLYDNALALSSIIQNSDEGIKLKNEIFAISKKNQLNAIVFQEFFNPKIEKIFFYIAVMTIFEIILKNLSIYSILTAFDGTPIGNSIISVAQKYDITTYSLRSFFLPPKPILKRMIKADKICVYGSHGFETLKKLGFDEKRIEIIGNPNYDYIHEIHDSTKKKICQILKLDYDKKLIIIGMGRWYENDDVWMSNLIKFCNNHDYQIIIKVHPIHETTEKSVHDYMVGKIKKACSELKFLIVSDIESSLILPAADLVITDHTNFGIEAALLKKPWLTVNFEGESSDFLFQIFDYSHSIYIEKYEELEKYIVEILEQNKHQNFFDAKYNELVNKFNYKNDGNASQRIFELLTQKNHN